MTEQQYRVIADRDKGVEPQYDDVETHHDRVTVEQYGQPTERIVRIERPVPTNDRREALRQLARDGQRMAARQERPSVPTREQIAEALTSVSEDAHAYAGQYMREADAVLALLNGADR